MAIAVFFGTCGHTNRSLCHCVLPFLSLEIDLERGYVTGKGVKKWRKWLLELTLGCFVGWLHLSTSGGRPVAEVGHHHTMTGETAANPDSGTRLSALQKIENVFQRSFVFVVVWRKFVLALGCVI